MGSSRARLLTLVAIAALAAGCFPSSTGKKSKLLGPQRTDAAPEGVVATVLSYDVAAPADDAPLLRSVCEGTGLTLETRGREVFCGPFLSRYEAGLWAGLTRDGRVAQHDVFTEPATTAPWEGGVGAYARTATSVHTRQVSNSRFAMVEWELADEEALSKRLSLERREDLSGFVPPEPVPGEEPPLPVEQKPELVEWELYQLETRTPRFISKLPLLPAFESSSGLGVARVGDENTLLQVVERAQRKDGKREDLVGWRFSVQGREKVFEAPFLDWVVTETGATMDVTRVRPGPDGVTLERHRVVLSIAPGAPRDAVIWNDWSSPRWVRADRPTLVTLERVERLDSRVEACSFMGG